MKRTIAFFLPLLMLCLICHLTVTAVENQESDTRGMMRVKTHEGRTIQLYSGSYALVIGNGNYQKGWDKLKGAVSDAKEVAKALEKHGFQVTLRTDVTKEAFNREFGDFTVKYGAGDENANNRLLFYYAGHGHTEEMATGEELGYIVMVDAPNPEMDSAGFRRNSVDVESLVTQAKLIKARHVLFMFDSCFSGSILNLREEVKPESISDSIMYPVRQFITAGRADEPVPDYSFFKQVFLDLIEGRDREPILDGYITGEELGLYLKSKVPEYNPNQHPQYGKIKEPKLDKGDFVFQLPLGTLAVTSTPGNANIWINNNLRKETTPTDLTMPPGKYTVTVERDDTDPATVEVTLGVGKVMPIDLKLPKQTQLYITSIPSGSKVDLGKLGVYQTPALIPTRVKPGVYKARATMPGFADASQSFRVIPHIRNPLELRLFPVTGAQMAWRSLLMPGLGQYYGGRDSTGTLFLLAGVGAAAGAAISWIQYDNAVDEYNASVERYNDAFEPDEFRAAKRAMIDAHDSADGKFALRRNMFIALGAVWGANMAHVLIAGPVRAPESPQTQAELPRWRIAPRVMPDSLSVMFAYRF